MKENNGEMTNALKAGNKQRRNKKKWRDEITRTKWKKTVKWKSNPKQWERKNEVASKMWANVMSI